MELGEYPTWTQVSLFITACFLVNTIGLMIAERLRCGWLTSLMKRLDALEQWSDETDAEMDGVERRLGKQASRRRAIAERVGDVEDRLEAVEHLLERHSQLTARVDALEKIPTLGERGSYPAHPEQPIVIPDTFRD